MKRVVIKQSTELLKKFPHSGKPHSKISKELISKNRKGKCLGEDNSKWMGNNVGYSGIHSWVRRMKGEAKICEFCKSEENVQWANKSRLYKREISDWIELCAKCHYIYDNKGEKRWKGYTKNSDRECLYCSRPVHGKDLCNMHYLREWRKI